MRDANKTIGNVIDKANVAIIASVDIYLNMLNMQTK